MIPRLESCGLHRRSEPLSHRTMTGFSLLEIAILLVIAGVLLGALLVPLATHSHARQNRATERDLKEIKEALIGFGISSGRLPCPDTTGDGREDLVVDPLPPPPYDCIALEGNLPWATLTVTATDAWDRIFRYRVNQEFAWPALTGQPAAPQPPPNNQLDMTDIGDIVVVTRGAAKSLLIETQAAAAVVYSVGIGGHGGTNLNGDTQPLPGALDQRSNVDGVYVAGTATGADGSANLTDDDADFVTAGVQVEHIVFNVSDRSHARVTNVAATTLTLDGPFSGTDNDFDTGDRYAVSPFVTRSYTPPTPDCQDRFGNASFPCGFDDLIVTVPAGVLKSRLIEANLLP